MRNSDENRLAKWLHEDSWKLWKHDWNVTKWSVPEVQHGISDDSTYKWTTTTVKRLRGYQTTRALGKSVNKSIKYFLSFWQKCMLADKGILDVEWLGILQSLQKHPFRRWSLRPLSQGGSRRQQAGIRRSEERRRIRKWLVLTACLSRDPLSGRQKLIGCSAYNILQRPNVLLTSDRYGYQVQRSFQ